MLSKKELVGRFFQVFFIILAFSIMYIGGLKFFLISIIFYGFGGVFEYLIMNYFYSKPTKKISKKDKKGTKLKNAFLWVHGNIEFIKKYNITIYDFDKIGLLVCIFSYIIMLFYVVLGFFLFKQFSYYGCLIYLIPLITNIYFFFRYRYFIFYFEKKK